MENKRKHLEMIQTIINRLSSNSFMLKGWSVTLIAAIYALSSKDTDKLYFFITYVPVIVFWCLDAYYLRLERVYRDLYKEVCHKDVQKIDFNMEVHVDSLNKNHSYSNCFLSITELWFYLPLALLTSLVNIISSIKILQAILY